MAQLQKQSSSSKRWRNSNYDRERQGDDPVMDEQLDNSVRDGLLQARWTKRQRLASSAEEKEELLDNDPAFIDEPHEENKIYLSNLEVLYHMATYGKIGFLVGAGGDVALQLINYYVPWLRNRGLVNYFRKHTKISSVLQAAGLTSLWSALYASQAGRNAGYRGFIVFSIFVDILYRLGHPYLYPTLDSYYEKNKWYSTVAYNAITAMMVQFGVDFYRLTQAQKLKTQYVY